MFHAITPIRSSCSTNSRVIRSTEQVASFRCRPEGKNFLRACFLVKKSEHSSDFLFLSMTLCYKSYETTTNSPFIFSGSDLKCSDTLEISPRTISSNIFVSSLPIIIFLFRRKFLQKFKIFSGFDAVIHSIRREYPE